MTLENRRSKIIPTNKPRFIVTVDDDLFQAIEDFRFENRYQNRNAAVLALLRAGFDALYADDQDGTGETNEEREVYQQENEKNDDVMDS